MPQTVWQLCGSTKRLLECRVDRTVSHVHALTVVLGHETFLREVYPDESSALNRARQVRKGLLAGGRWSVVTHADGTR